MQPEKCHWWAYLQGRNGDTDLCLREWTEKGDELRSTDMHTLCCPQSLDSVWRFATPWAARSLCPLGFSWQEYRSGLPVAPPGDLPSLAIKPESLVSPALASRFLTTEPPGKPWHIYTTMCKTDSYWEAGYMTQGTQLGGLRWGPRGVGLEGEEGSRRSGYTYSYKWFLILYSRDQHNIVKQLPSN